MKDASKLRTSKLFGTSTIVDMSDVALLLHCLALSLWRSFGNSLGQESHEFRSGTSLVEAERRKVAGSA